MRGHRALRLRPHYDAIVSSDRRAKKARSPGSSLERLTFGGVKVVFLSAPLERTDVLTELTPAEHAVARLVASGSSNAEIGRARGASPRTIANQLASIYRKLGVGSRAELIALLDG
jgi:DNA-binding CsgD family transcriptional regulator